MRIPRAGMRVPAVVFAAVLIALAGAGSVLVGDAAEGSHAKNIEALVLISENYGLNFHLIRDELDLFGWRITLAGVKSEIEPCTPESGMTPAFPDVLVGEVKDLSAYDCLIIPPGPGNAREMENAFGDLLESPEALALIASAVRQGLPVFAMCSGTRVLAAAGVLQGRKVVGSPRFAEEYKKAGAEYMGNPRNDTAPLIDGNIITAARGQSYNKANCQAISTAVEARLPNGARTSRLESTVSAIPLGFEVEGLAWAKALGGPGSEGGRALCPASDGGFLITGYTFSGGSGDSDLLLVKTGPDGKPSWSTTFGGAGSEYGFHVLAVDDGCLITGYTTSFGQGSKDIYAVRVDARGNEIWSKTFGGPGRDVGVSAAQAGDGYVICGYTDSSGKGEEDILLFKIDRNGREVWSRTFGGARMEIAAGIAPAADGGFFIAASSLSFTKNTDFLLVRTDAEGQELWSKTYPLQGPRGHGFEWCAGLAALRDGGVVLVGYGDASDLMDIYAVRTDASGNEVWKKTLERKGRYDFSTAVRETNDGGLTIAGATKAFVPDKRLADNDVYLMKLDAGGQVLWEKAFGLPGRDWAASAVVSEAGETIVCGHTNSSGNGLFDILLAKIR